MTKEQIKQDLMNMKDMDSFRAYVEDLMTQFHEEALEVAYIEHGVTSMQELQYYDSKITIFDCGWLLWSFEDEELNDKMAKLMKKKWGFAGRDMRLNSPTFVQSTNIQKVAADVIKNNLEPLLPMKYTVHLD